MFFDNKSYVVFGGASGLGLATASLLAARGANVMISDRAEHAPSGVTAAPGRMVGYAVADVTDEMQVCDVFKVATDRFGEIHGVVNTAGVVHGERLLGKSGVHSLDGFERVVRVNLIGAFNVLRLAAQTMAQNSPGEDGERGVVVNTASVAAFDGQIGQIAYAASKAAVVGMTLPAARDLARHGIRVVAVAPGMFETPMVASLPDAVKGSLEALVPFPSRFGKPMEYASLVCHVLENPMLNGEVIRLDGALRMPPN